MPDSKLALSVRGLSKDYKISHNSPRHTTAAEALIHRIKNPFERTEIETFWALKDVSFDVFQGDVVGVIGRNGAGKSTLLKLLSRITEPSRGEINLYGRLGSLLEVGTGFHPELTGRENVYLNGAILGMRKSEIARQFDAIVEFADVEKFLDTPVKRYSSGMYVRLAFAVAAHLNPEILVIDEVLAVGDAEFQKKCLGKMQEVSQHQGRTILFVSHNTAAVRSLCTRALFMNQGKLVCDSDVETALSMYIADAHFAKQLTWKRGEDSTQTALYFNEMSVVLAGEQPHHRLEIVLDLHSVSPHKAAFIAVDIINSQGVPIMQALPKLEGFVPSEPRDHRVELVVDLPPLIPGLYSLNMWAGSHNSETFDYVKSCLVFEITKSPTPGRSFPHTSDHGHIVAQSAVSYSPVC